MRDALGSPQTILLLGGTSDLGLAIVDEIATASTRRILSAVRDPGRGEAALARLRPELRDRVELVPFDADDVERHVALVDDAVARVGDLDVVVLAFGVLGDQATFDADPVAAARAVTTNYVGAVSVSLAVAARLRAQGHGELIVLSSVAGERVRRANFVYGSSKAGLDGFAQGLADSLEGSGASVLIVRPGFVRTAMTEGRDPAPFATEAAAVAADVARARLAGRRIVWSPGVLRWVFAVMRHLPGPIWRRLPDR